MITLSLAEARRRLAPGREFTCEFIGSNARHCKPELRVTRRRVLKQSAQEMCSEVLDGPFAGTPIYLTWRGTAVEEHPDQLLVYMLAHDGLPAAAFLKLTF
jgi:hypothetical protein